MSPQTNAAPPVKAHASVRVEVTEYDPVTGSATRNLSSLNFDRTTLAQFSTPVVIKMNVIGVQKINNVKIGIVKSSTAVTSSGTTNSDGSKTDGNVGIEHSPQLVSKSTLTSFFAGENTDGSPSDANNVSVNRSSDTESEYIYINAKMPDQSGRGYIGFKWFFDFV